MDVPVSEWRLVDHSVRLLFGRQRHLQIPGIAVSILWVGRTDAVYGATIFISVFSAVAAGDGPSLASAAANAGREQPWRRGAYLVQGTLHRPRDREGRIRSIACDRQPYSGWRGLCGITGISRRRDEGAVARRRLGDCGRFVLPRPGAHPDCRGEASQRSVRAPCAILGFSRD